jgi:hypothetical protein
VLGAGRSRGPSGPFDRRKYCVKTFHTMPGGRMRNMYGCACGWSVCGYGSGRLTRTLGMAAGAGRRGGGRTWPHPRRRPSGGRRRREPGPLPGSQPAGRCRVGGRGTGRHSSEFPCQILPSGHLRGKLGPSRTPFRRPPSGVTPRGVPSGRERRPRHHRSRSGPRAARARGCRRRRRSPSRPRRRSAAPARRFSPPAARSAAPARCRPGASMSPKPVRGPDRPPGRG